MIIYQCNYKKCCLFYLNLRLNGLIFSPENRYLKIYIDELSFYVKKLTPHLYLTSCVVKESEATLNSTSTNGRQQISLYGVYTPQKCIIYKKHRTQ